MEIKGRLFIIIGILFTIGSTIIDKNSEMEEEWFSIISVVFLGIGTILVISGVVMIFRAKKKKK
jgi:putative effector of murein hydrolase LrgA (UPF0299 family)